ARLGRRPRRSRPPDDQAPHLDDRLRARNGRPEGAEGLFQDAPRRPTGMLSGMKQRTIRAAALCAILSASSVALAQSAPCPKFERGARYPWQTTEIMPGDRYTSIALDVDRSGFPIRCAFGKNNFPDP